MSKRAQFAAIYEREFGRIRAYAYSRTRDWAVAEDIAADTFVLAWEQREQFLADDGRFTDIQAARHGYLLTIARRLIGRHFYAQRRRVTFSQLFAEVPDDASDLLADSDNCDALVDAFIAETDTAMAAALLRAALRTCTPTQLQMLELRYTRGLSEAATARKLGLTRKQYDRRHQVLLQHLGGCFFADIFHPSAPL